MAAPLSYSQYQCQLNFSLPQAEKYDPSQNQAFSDSVVTTGENIEVPAVPVKRKKNRLAKPELWAKAIRKKKRNTGEQYVTKRGIIKPARIINEEYQCKCPRKCHEKLTREQRQQNYESFYSNGSWSIQTTYIAMSVKRVPIKRRKSKKTPPAAARKQHSHEYYLQAGSNTVRVCKQMFMQTLVIDSARIHRALVKGETGNFTDQRGKHTPGNKTAEVDAEMVRRHIGSFPTFTNQYARHSSLGRVYLSSDLNVSSMYKLYSKMMQDRAKQVGTTTDPQPAMVSASTYKHIFYSEFNIRFKVPQKDNCKKCNQMEPQQVNSTILESQNAPKKPLSQPEPHNNEVNVIAVNQIAVSSEKMKNCEFLVGTTSDEKKILPTTKPVAGAAKLKLCAKDIRKKKRNAGEQYITTRGVVRPAKCMKEEFHCKCPWKCHEKLTLSQRQQNYDTFYSNASWSIQTTYIAKSVKTVPIKRRKCTKPADSKKQHTREYYLQASGDSVRVCKQMFMQTLAIDSARIHRALIKGRTGNLTDQRGRHTPGNKTSDIDVEAVRRHIRSYPTQSSQYSRHANSDRVYLSHDLNVSAMYKQYAESMKEHIARVEINAEPFPSVVRLSTYKRIFYTDFNIRFKLPPHKDSCKKCDKVKPQPETINAPPICVERETCTKQNAIKPEQHHIQADVEVGSKAKGAQYYLPWESGNGSDSCLYTLNGIMMPPIKGSQTVAYDSFHYSVAGDFMM